MLEERTYLIGVEVKNTSPSRGRFSIGESLKELGQLAETAGLAVVGSTVQRFASLPCPPSLEIHRALFTHPLPLPPSRLDSPNSKTYIGAGKVSEVRAAVAALRVETVIMDDELSPGQLRNLEKELGASVRVCDRTALILDIFRQRARTKEASLQVELALTEYQLPRLTRMWTHLERQAGGLVKGMGEKQIEVDKRILRSRVSPPQPAPHPHPHPHPLSHRV